MSRQFPPEIVQLIVEASLDPHDLFTSSERDLNRRYKTLKSYSLLNSTWHGVSEPELVKSVELHTAGSVKNFLEMAERRGGTVEGVRDFFVEGRYDGDRAPLAKPFKATPHLLILYCHAGTIASGDLARLQMLRRLELVSAAVVGSPSSSLLCLPHLQRLCITETEAEDSASHFLTPAFLPQLRRIDIQSDDFSSITPLIQQLEIVTSEYGFHDYALLSRAKSLLLLPLSSYSDDRLAMFSNFSSLPPFLHVDFASQMDPVSDIDFDVDHEIAVALEEVLESKKPGLRFILLNDDGLDDSIKSLIERIEERGVRVKLVDMRMDLDDAIEEMYRIRAEEKRAAEDAQM